jgi:hypothetical protein
MARGGTALLAPLSKNDMKQIITAKLKLIPMPEQFQALRQTSLAYRDGLNAVSRYAFEHGKLCASSATTPPMLIWLAQETSP